MRGRRARWLWMLVPALGGAAMFLAPPMDEYAALDRVGTPFNPLRTLPPLVSSQFPGTAGARGEAIMRQANGNPGPPDERDEVTRFRGWRVRLSETESQRMAERAFSERVGWQLISRDVYTYPARGGKARTVSTIYANGETGDQAAVDATTPLAPARGEPSTTVTVYQSRASLQPWPHVKRWARRAFSP